MPCEEPAPVEPRCTQPGPVRRRTCSGGGVAAAATGPRTRPVWRAGRAAPEPPRGSAPQPGSRRAVRLCAGTAGTAGCGPAPARASPRRDAGRDSGTEAEPSCVMLRSPCLGHADERRGERGVGGREPGEPNPERRPDRGRFSAWGSPGRRMSS